GRSKRIRHGNLVWRAGAGGNSQGSRRAPEHRNRENREVAGFREKAGRDGRPADRQHFRRNGRPDQGRYRALCATDKRRQDRPAVTFLLPEKTPLSGRHPLPGRFFLYPAVSIGNRTSALISCSTINERTW